MKILELPKLRSWSFSKINLLHVAVPPPYAAAPPPYADVFSFQHHPFNL